MQFIKDLSFMIDGAINSVTEKFDESKINRPVYGGKPPTVSGKVINESIEYDRNKPLPKRAEIPKPELDLEKAILKDNLMSYASADNLNIDYLDSFDSGLHGKNKILKSKSNANKRLPSLDDQQKLETTYTYMQGNKGNIVSYKQTVILPQEQKNINLYQGKTELEKKRNERLYSDYDLNQFNSFEQKIDMYGKVFDPTKQYIGEGGKLVTGLAYSKPELNARLEDLDPNHPLVLANKHNYSNKNKTVYNQNSIRKTIVADTLRFRKFGWNES